MPWLGSRTLPAPTSARPSTAPEAWSTPACRRGHRGLRPGIKFRPRTPLVVGHSPAGPGKRLLADLQLHAGTYTPRPPRYPPAEPFFLPRSKLAALVPLWRPAPLPTLSMPTPALRAWVQPLGCLALPFTGVVSTIHPRALRCRAPLTGALKRLLPTRFRRTSGSEVLHLQPNELNQSSPESSPESSPDTRADLAVLEARRIVLPRSFPPRAEREAAAASMGVDVTTWEALVRSGRGWRTPSCMTRPPLGWRVHLDVSRSYLSRRYNMLMDMQHRDITPEDYDMLSRLDSSVQPKTLSPRVLDKRAPSWCVPEVSSPEEDMPLPPGMCVAASDPAAAATVAASLSELSLSSSRSRSSRLSGQQCSICLEDLSAGERVRRLPCGHIFHASCVDEWLTRRSNVCPDDGLPVRRTPQPFPDTLLLIPSRRHHRQIIF